MAVRGINAVHTIYTSDEVPIPDSFLVDAPFDAEPIEMQQIDFANSSLPMYDDCFALLLENVLSPSECVQLVKLAEQSAKTQGWKPAMVNVGGNYEVLAADYRNSDRIIWDSPELVNRLWNRCMTVPGFGDKLLRITGNDSIQGERAVMRGDVWNFLRVNERMRFLRYGPGQFFDRHCDGSYVDPASEGRERTLMTLQLYLNSAEGVKGGATTFHPPGFSKKGPEPALRVTPKLGRVLIFQHRRLWHSGEQLEPGSKSKITMRTDIMYRLEQSSQD